MGMESRDLSAFALRGGRFFLLVAAICFGGLGTAWGGEQIFEVKGVVRGPVTEGTVLIEHEDIEGFMPAMTMPFYLGEGEPKERIGVGDTVSFRFVVGDGSSRAESFEVLNRAVAARAVPEGNANELKAGQIGQMAPGFSLLDERGRVVDQDTFKGKYTVVTFVFTRCPVPEFCPLLSRKFARLQGLLEREGEELPVRLLSVSLDPLFDTPDVLSNYAQRVGADADIWRFATGELEEVGTLARFADLSFSGEGVAISHELRTLLFGPDGRLIKKWSGNRWKAEGVFGAIQEDSVSSR